MEHHPDLDMPVHTTEELAALLGESVTERRHVHGWPLSLVEALTTSSGARWIYKAQRSLPAESALYAAAGRTAILADCRVLTDDGTSSTMLLEHLGSPVSVDGLATEEVVALCRSVVEAIGTLPDGLPHHLDWGSPSSFRSVADRTLDELEVLVGSGAFTHTTADDVAALRSWAHGDAVTGVLDGPTRLTCCDIKLDQVFRAGDGWKVVDWQVPVVGPGDLDLVGLLEHAGIDPREHTDPTIVALWWFRLVHWAVLAKTELLPEITELFDVWASLGAGNVRRS